ncbi:glycosyltransferase family 2 protein [Gemelliphila palaticanis]|uniref:Glycosyltransferase family 2 protein n=1 Tax=Gemelliphila palaticanis TaxID=81950 RepID=A0ABX2SYV0_9BACL|nr:glycosyltransferase family 2 protein [Gemella palaticanis]MBF0715595.1 glycosyltransferase family 2 protein [Gemella palaticanis]NYS47525.1 glycosyltransferase family 2 protein [Gemella palaticanis]
MNVSVIIPVYNVEKYLRYAVDSVLSQSYKNLEIILINDGSIDLSGKICDFYAEKYNNIRVFHILKNNGLSYARNYGIEKSRGQFIVFLDPDDYIEYYALEEMVKLQNKYDADIVSTKINRVTIHKNPERKLYRYKYYYCSSIEGLKYMYLDEIATVSACAKLYKKNIFENLEYPLGKIYEDFYIIPEVVKNAKKIIIADLYTYNYYKRANSISNTKYSKKQRDFFIAAEHNYNVIKKYKNSEIIKLLEYKIFKGVQSIIKMAVISNEKEELKYIKNKIKKYSFLFSNLSFKIKFKLILFMINTDMYYFIVRKRNKNENVGKF